MDEDPHLVIFDDSDGISTIAYLDCDSWVQRTIYLGSPWPSENFFKPELIEGGQEETNEN